MKQPRRSTTLHEYDIFSFSGRDTAKEYQVLKVVGFTVYYKDPDSGGEDSFSVQSVDVIWKYT